jgi:hypothetical protein
VAGELDDSGTKWLGEGVGEVYGSLLSLMAVVVEAEEDQNEGEAEEAERGGGGAPA